MERLERNERYDMKTRIREMSFKKKVLVASFLSVFLISLGAGYYILSHQSITSYAIVGGVSAFGITQDLSPVTLNVSENLTDTQQIILENPNSNILMFYNLTKDVNVTDLGCSGDNDVSFVLLSDEGVIVENFTMEAGTNTFDLIVTATNDRTCPQNIDIQIDFTE